VRAPVGYALGDGRVTFSLALRNKETDETIAVANAMALSEAPLSPALLRRETPGTRIWSFNVTPEQRDAIIAARETALNWETREADMRQMSIAVDTRPCLMPGANPFQEPKFTIFMKTALESDWMTLVREADDYQMTGAGDIGICETVPADAVE